MGPALDVAIGLVFLYAVLALVCSSLNETLATLVGLRARFLQAGLVNLLGGQLKGGIETLKTLLDSPLLQALSRPGHGGDDVGDAGDWTDPR